MRNFLPFICFVLFSSQIATAQTEYTVPENFPAGKAKTVDVLNNDKGYRGVIVNSWYDYGYLSNYNYSSDNKAFINNFLFPDSAYFQYSQSDIARGSNYKEATIIDPKADLFKTLIDPDFGKYLSYNVDSVTILFRYHRNTGVNIVDTLFVEIGSDSTLATSYLNGNSILTDYGVNSLSFKLLKFKATASGVGELSLPKKDIIPILLTSAYATDTGFAGISSLTIHPSLTRFKGGENVVVGLSFKPGFNYTVNDTITKTGNTFQTFSWEEQGANTYPQYTAGEWNCSYWAYYDNLLPLDPALHNWYQVLFPSWVWPKDFPEHNWVMVKTSYDDDWLGVSENPQEIAGGTCFPNPSTNQMLIAYSLKNQQQISVNVYDVTGQLVLQKQEGNQAEGQHFAQINLNNLSSGVYFYSINNGEMKKFVKD